MQAKNMEWLVKNAPRFAAASPDNPFLKSVAESIEASIVVPSILKAKLLAAGFKVSADDEDHAKYGFRVLKNLYRVHVVGPANLHPERANEGEARTLIAAGASDSEADALLHAALGFVRECEIRAAKDAGKAAPQFGIGDAATLGVK